MAMDAHGAEHDDPYRSASLAWFWVGAASAALACVLHLFGTGPTHWAGYALGTFVTILFIALYRWSDRRASASPWHSPRPAIDRGTVLVLVVGVLAASGHALFLAVEAAR